MQKSSQNIQKAKLLADELKQASLIKNKDFINLHSENRKRRFNDSSNFNFSNSNIEMKEVFSNENRKIVKFAHKKLNLKKNEENEKLFSNYDISLMLKEVNLLKTEEEIKDYLNYKLSMKLSK